MDQKNNLKNNYKSPYDHLEIFEKKKKILNS